MAREDPTPGKHNQLEGERRRLTEQLAACMRLTAIGQLAAGVAHELNNPLSVILGYAQSMMHQFAADETLTPSLRTIEREAQRCKRVVQDLLNFSRLPLRGKVMEDILDVMEGALSLIETQARIQDVELSRDFSEHLPTLYIDRHRIQQMIINLCTNALDAMPKGGRLTIGVSMMPTLKTPRVRIRISDTGIGIPEKIRERIFEPFFTTKELGKGTGLGLTLVQEVVNEHEAQLEISSEPHQGTTFTIGIPALRRTDMASEKVVSVRKTSALRNSK